MVFSYLLTIDGYDFYDFGDMRISQNIDGFGTSGVCTSEFTVTIPTDDYEAVSIHSNAPVILYLSEYPNKITPIYYISTRSKKNGSVTFKCFDRMVYTDQTAFVADFEFTDGYISSNRLVSIIAEQCGFEGWAFGGSSEQGIDFKISKEYISGKTCRELLEAISAAWCGYFKVSNEDVLLFESFGAAYTFNETAEHTQITEGCTKGPIKQVIMTNGMDTYFAGDTSADVFGTIKITTDFASQTLANRVLERVEDVVYEAWNCDKCIMSDSALGCSIEIPAEITFADGSVRIANNVIKIPTSTGIYVTCGQNEVTENEFDYTGALSREINKRIADGEKLGNETMITRYQGLIHLGEKVTDDDGNVTQNRYGYSAATSGGIVEFDGALTSKVVPSSATVNADKTEAVVAYNDKSYKYNITYGTDGNITGFTKSEVTKE